MAITLNQLKKQTIILCPICNKEYKPTNIKSISKVNDMILAHSNCPRCQSSILSLLYKDMLGITMVGMVTDLNYNDAIKAKKHTAINENDVLEIYEQIN